MTTRYELGTRHHNGKFIGWAVWKVHPSCTKSSCPVTIAEFYGKGANRHAMAFIKKLYRAVPK